MNPFENHHAPNLSFEQRYCVLRRMCNPYLFITLQKATHPSLPSATVPAGQQAGAGRLGALTRREALPSRAKVLTTLDTWAWKRACFLPPLPLLASASWIWDASPCPWGQS